MTVAGVDYPGLAVVNAVVNAVSASVIEFFSQALHGVDAAIERVQQAVDMPGVTVDMPSPVAALGTIHNCMHMVCQAVEIFQVRADMAQ